MWRLPGTMGYIELSVYRVGAYPAKSFSIVCMHKSHLNHGTAGTAVNVFYHNVRTAYRVIWPSCHGRTSGVNPNNHTSGQPQSKQPSRGTIWMHPSAGESFYLFLFIIPVYIHGLPICARTHHEQTAREPKSLLSCSPPIATLITKSYLISNDVFRVPNKKKRIIHMEYKQEDSK